jgi:hypothetical protein
MLPSQVSLSSILGYSVMPGKGVEIHIFVSTMLQPTPSNNELHISPSLKTSAEEHSDMRQLGDYFRLSR